MFSQELEADTTDEMRITSSVDVENAGATRAKSALLGKPRAGLTTRGALGDLSNAANLPARINKEECGKMAATAVEFEKKATISRVPAPARSAIYKNVSARVYTGLATKSAVPVPVPSTRPPLRREESTASHAARAVAQRQAAKIVKEKSRSKETTPTEINANDENKKEKNCDEVKPRKVAIVKPQGMFVEPKVVQRQPMFLASPPSLPANIEDIDARDDNSPLLLSAYIKDIYKYLTEMEEKYSIRPDHLKQHEAVTGKMRATLIDWLVDVHRQFNLLLETFQMTVGIIDRYLQLTPEVPRKELQLIGVTAMFIAGKYEEIYAPEITDIVYVSDNAYTKKDVFKCERDIMTKLEFCLGRPIPLHFLRRFVKAAHGNSMNHHLAKYFVDLCLVEYTMAHYRPSELAAAAMCLSLFLLSGDKEIQKTWTPTLKYYSGYTFSQLEPIIRKIAAIVHNVGDAKLKAVQNRYKEPSLASVACLPELEGPIIKELCRA